MLAYPQVKARHDAERRSNLRTSSTWAISSDERGCSGPVEEVQHRSVYIQEYNQLAKLVGPENICHGKGKESS